MTRLDSALVERGLAVSRTRAKSLIEGGNVTVAGRTVTKPAFPVGDGDIIAVNDALKYVSRGGLKLEAALDAFGIDVSGMTAADIGASTGGFTDCMLQRGALHVYAIDSGSAQLAPVLRDDSRVTVFENFNARSLSPELFGTPCDIAVMDVSFISQTLLHAPLMSILAPGGIFVSLIKPQFEVGRGGLGKHGIVRDDKKRADAIEKVIASAANAGFLNRGVIESPVRGGDGNIEYLAYFIGRR